MSFYDKIMLTALFLTVFSSMLERSLTYLRLRHDSALARLVGLASRLAAEAGSVLRSLPPQADAAALKQALIARGVDEAKREFAASIGVVGASDAKLAQIISREIDKVAPAVPGA